MKRSQLKTKTNKTRYPKGFINYKEPRNPVVNRKQKNILTFLTGFTSQVMRLIKYWELLIVFQS